MLLSAVANLILLGKMFCKYLIDILNLYVV
jgi:hypothetical protein